MRSVLFDCLPSVGIVNKLVKARLPLYPVIPVIETRVIQGKGVRDAKDKGGCEL